MYNFLTPVFQIHFAFTTILIIRNNGKPLTAQQRSNSQHRSRTALMKRHSEYPPSQLQATSLFFTSTETED